METAMTAAGRRWTARDAHTTHTLLLRTHTVATASAQRPKGRHRQSFMSMHQMAKATMAPLTF